MENTILTQACFSWFINMPQNARNSISEHLEFKIFRSWKNVILVLECPEHAVRTYCRRFVCPTVHPSVFLILTPFRITNKHVYNHYNNFLTNIQKLIHLYTIIHYEMLPFTPLFSSIQARPRFCTISYSNLQKVTLFLTCQSPLRYCKLSNRCTENTTVLYLSNRCSENTKVL